MAQTIQFPQAYGTSVTLSTGGGTPVSLGADPQNAPRTTAQIPNGYAGITPGGSYIPYDFNIVDGPAAPAAPAGPSAEDVARQQAAAAEANRQNAIRGRTRAGVDNQYSSTGIKYNDFGNEYNRTTRDWATEYIKNQNSLNANQANNQLNLRRGMASIAGGIRDAIRSGGVTLANMNASTSSAGEALARAFARQGNQQFNDVNNQAQLARNELDVEQGYLNQHRTDKLEDFDVWGDTTLNNLNEGLRQALVAVEADAVAEGVTGAVDFSRREQLYNDARSRIDQLDAALQQRLQGVGAHTPEQIEARAAEMDVAGMEGYNPFRLNFNGQVSRGGAGAPLGQLPFYTTPRRDDEYYYS